MVLAIKIENISKLYRLGAVGTGTISHDLNQWWHLVRGKEDPYSKIGQKNDRTAKSNAESDYVWALKDINIEIEQGEIVGIIGRNGAGKSTLLKLLSRVTAPTTGSIKARGRIASLLEVGTGFHPELSGRENIYVNGAIMGMGRHEIKSRLDEIVEFSGCARYLDTPVKRYSSGMMVRLGFAVAAHLESDILIVDEVLAVGDAEFQRKCIGKMRETTLRSGKSVLFVSHDLGAVSSLCARAFILEGGTLTTMGKADDMVAYYNRQLRSTHHTHTRDASFSGKPIRATAECEPIVSGGDLNIVFTVESCDEVDVAGISLIIVSEMGHRVAVIDLRAELESFRVTTEKPVTICGCIKQLNLVEGYYSIGAYVQTSVYTGDLTECGWFEVKADASSIQSELVRFPSRHRGIVDLKHRDFEIVRSN